MSQGLRASILDTPWRLSNHAKRIAYEPYLRVLFALNGVRWGRKWRVFGAPVIQRVRGSEIVIGDGVELRSSLQSNPLAPNHPVILATRTSHATIRIGNDCGLTAATIVAAERVELGERVLVGANATIVDTDFHPLDPVARRERHAPGRHAAVRIEDDVFIGMNSIILKGTTLGAGCVVGAGSVVCGSFSAGTVVAGNPARVVRGG
jgi:acetyltransferase-like isoleucine patch superfamily enzyme